MVLSLDFSRRITLQVVEQLVHLSNPCSSFHYSSPLTQTTPGIPKEPSNESSLPPFPDRPSFLADILRQGIRAHSCLLQGCHCRPSHTCLLSQCVSSHTASRRPPSSDMHSPPFSSIVVLFSSNFSRLKLQVVDSRCANSETLRN